MNPRSARLTRVIAVGVTTVALAMGAAACSDDPSPAAAGAPSSQPAGGSVAPQGGSSTGTPTSGAPGTGKPAAGGSAQASSRCHTGDLKADIQVQSAGSAMVMLTNKGSRACTVNGYLGYGGLLADNSAVNLPTTRAAHPGQPVQITLKPGVSAFSGLKWSPCGKADPSCKVLAGVVVTPPDETTQLTAAVLGLDGKAVTQLTVSAPGFTVGSLQPVSQGVVFS